MRERPLILIVEDDPEVQGFIAMLMEMEGYEAVTARDGLEALIKAEFRNPSLILLDIMMPDVDGMRVLEELRVREALSGIPVLIITGRADAHETFDALVGRDNVFPKPFDSHALTARVAELLAGGKG